MFDLHERLAEDCHWLGDFPLCRLLLMNDSHYPWFILVPRVAGIREVYELPEEQQVQVLQESSLLGRCIMGCFHGHKLNVAALGNMVPQLHLHHIVRFPSDVAWPGPVWGKVPPTAYDDAELARIKGMMGEVLSSQAIDYQAA
ncbi:HIT family protein [Hahella sp. CCB-MM4]|uniref:HIT domain-containing protein n=1 Tax=Hahella sp. (strain CCB-MM4) TaxID=1926491 RepID=UPI000B9B0348|nr:HIT domain-containing protein [Hahella sp. CCB-MM4]OZG72101.1 HIT family protein [Hahella sp. CCB-MM4]